MIDPTELRKLLRYEPETGKLYWLPRKANAPYVEAWNTKYANTEALTNYNAFGYRRGSIFAKGYLAHRVIWALVHGEWPEDEIDHINGVRNDNRINNLRAVNRVGNLQNAAIRSDNTSGNVGISWHHQTNKWMAYIRAEGRRIYLGVFDNKQEAVAARKAAEAKYGFHANHGRAAA